MYSRSCSDIESAKRCFEFLLSHGANSMTKDVRHRDVASYMEEDRQHDLIQILEMHDAKKAANYKSD